MSQFVNRTWSYFFVLICLLSLASCSSSNNLADRSSRTSKARKSKVIRSSSNRALAKNTTTRNTLNTKRKLIVESTKKYLGSTYKYGGKSIQSGFDCSGFTSKVYQDNGLNVKGASYEQATMGNSRSKSTAQPGDLVTFAKNGKVFHVAIVTDIDADHVWVAHSTSSKGVIVNEIWNSNYWKPKIHEFRNVVN